MRFKVDVGEKRENPYRKGSFKHTLMGWALEKGEFTQEEFNAALLHLKAEYEVHSKMKDEVLVRAWWNEFKNKHKTFTAVE